MIIGITGKYCSGKDVIADYLGTKSFKHISLSDMIRDMLRAEGKKCTRENLIKYANNLRSKNGPGALARLALDKMEPNANYVITSIRNPTEIEVLKVMKNFVLVDVIAPIEKRFDRMQKRTRTDKLLTLQDFKKKEEEEHSDDPEKQQLHKCSEMARVVVRNNGALAELHKKIDKFLKDWMPKLQKRPSWDEYFMGIVHAVAARGTCERGRTATVVVRNKRILATGYVGAPMGLPDCDEIGHQMKKTVHEDGSESWHCVRTTHSELNALALAARNGVAVDGATMYMKMAPCYTCAKVLINAGIVRVVCEKDYHVTSDSKKIFKQAGIKLEILTKEVMFYSQQ
jgi:dCMP deaminase